MDWNSCHCTDTKSPQINQYIFNHRIKEFFFFWWWASLHIDSRIHIEIKRDKNLQNSLEEEQSWRNCKTRKQDL